MRRVLANEGGTGGFEAEGVPARVVSTSASHHHPQHARTTSPPGHDSRLTTRHARMPDGQRGGAGVERKLMESEIGRSHLSLVLGVFFLLLFFRRDGLTRSNRVKSYRFGRIRALPDSGRERVFWGSEKKSHNATNYDRSLKVANREDTHTYRKAQLHTFSSVVASKRQLCLTNCEMCINHHPPCNGPKGLTQVPWG